MDTQGRILTLGIESSCDETSAAVVAEGRFVLSNIISSQIEIHKSFGGVVPEIASRKHVEAIISVIDASLQEAGVSLQEIDQIGVTFGPGLIGALLVGLSAAKALSYTLSKPLVPVHHIEGHISANFIEYKDLEPPFVCLVASGGHSHIVDCRGYGDFVILGRTRDDAAGEAFDKISRALGLGYPGGPVVDKFAKAGNPNAVAFPKVHFSNSLDFSFSGVKTAVLNYMNNTKAKGDTIVPADVCASFQKAVVEILVENLMKANEMTGYGKICLAGGVAANSCLRAAAEQAAKKAGAAFFRPSPVLCTDNGAMIACAAYFAGDTRTAGPDLNAAANVSIENLSGLFHKAANQ
ncbi:MAG: tRNA (adenosine(37)-N6)-threonylcarbamoyltransferase complex transferase subunit TsaD [Clostridia bacterium]